MTLQLTPGFSFGRPILYVSTDASEPDVAALESVGEWTADAIAEGFRSRLTGEFQILTFVQNGFITGPGGADFGSAGFIVNCPIVFRFL